LPANLHGCEQASEDESRRSVSSGPDRPVTLCAVDNGGAIRLLRPSVSKQPNERESAPDRQSRLAARGHRVEAGCVALDLWELQRLVSPKLRRPVLFTHAHHATGETGELQPLTIG